MTSIFRRSGHLLKLAGACAWILGSAGCSGGSPATGLPESGGPGQLTVTVSGGPSPGYGYLLTVSGPDIGTPSPVGDAILYSSLSGSELTAAVLMGTAGDGRILMFAVPDVDNAEGYTVHLDQISDADNAIRDAASYSVSIVK